MHKIIQKQYFLITLVLVLILALSFIFIGGRDGGYKSEKIRIAVCPTCYESVADLSVDKYQIIPTKSTAESIKLLWTGQADLVLAGRSLMPNEPIMNMLVVREGYSFISNQEEVIYIDELQDRKVYTDLDPELIQKVFLIKDIERVEDVYQYLDRGIVITSWDNTDYMRATIVHLLETENKRVELSRRPTIYCPETCGREAEEIALSIR